MKIGDLYVRRSDQSTWRVVKTSPATLVRALGRDNRPVRPTMLARDYEPFEEWSRRQAEQPARSGTTA